MNFLEFTLGISKWLLKKIKKTKEIAEKLKLVIAYLVKYNSFKQQDIAPETECTTSDNTSCEVKLIEHSLFSIDSLTPVASDVDIFAIIEKSAIDCFIQRNKTNRAHREMAITCTHVIMNIDNNQSMLVLLAYLESTGSLIETTVAGMFYKIYLCENFETVTIHVKIYFREEGVPYVEFRRVNGCRELLYKIYGGFKNLVLGQNEVFGFYPPFIPMDRLILSIDEEVSMCSNLVSLLRTCLPDGIKIISKCALEKNKQQQTTLLNEVFKALYILKKKDLQSLIVQTLGYINVLYDASCLLEHENKKKIINRLRPRIEAMYSEIPLFIKLHAEILFAKVF
jgi:hypothetical protein